MAIKRYAVLGAGAIGAYVGASIARGGGDVTLIARGAHLEAMRESGVRVLSDRGDFNVTMPVTDNGSELEPFDCIIVGLKATQLVAMLPRIQAMSHPETRVINMQNGIPWWYFQHHGGVLEDTWLESVDPGGKLAGAIDPHRVVGCVIYSSTEIESPGVIRHIEGTRYVLGRPDGGTDDEILQISAAMVAGGLKAPVEEDIRAQIWLKLLGNAALTPISALTRTTLATMLSDVTIVAIVRRIMEECVAIATALGVTLPVSIDKRIDGARRVGEHKTSMLQDVELGRPLEYDCMTGAVIEIGKKLGIATPETERIHAMTRLLDIAVRAGQAVPAAPSAAPAASSPEPSLTAVGSG
jgi:2-dehydropantoate 2-reductase